jgi:hypothetical protein
MERYTMKRVQSIRPLIEVDDGVKGWIYKTARKHWWRCQDEYELDDLISDGLWLWYRTARQYVRKQGRDAPEDPAPRARSAHFADRVVIDRPHLMALFKRVYTQHLKCILPVKRGAKRDRATGQITNPKLLPFDSDFMSDHLLEDGSGDLCVLITQAPEPVKKVLELFSTESGREQLRAAYPRRDDKTKETLNERLCRLCGIDPSTNVVSMLRQHFNPAV